MVFSGGVTVAGPAYIGTVTLRATRDARGTFDLALPADGSTFLLDSGNKTIPHQPVEPIAITVSTPAGSQSPMAQWGSMAAWLVPSKK